MSDDVEHRDTLAEEKVVRPKKELSRQTIEEFKAN